MKIAAFLMALSAIASADCVTGKSRPATPDELNFEKSTRATLEKTAEGTMPSGWTSRSRSSLPTQSYCSGDAQPVPVSYRVEYENAPRKAKFMQDLAASGNDQTKMKKAMDEASRDAGAIIAISANTTFCGMDGDSVKPISIPGAKFAWRSDSTNGEGGGEAKATLACFGNWQQTRSSATSMSAEMKFAAGAPRTAIHNIVLRIQADPDRADQLLKTIKVAQLAAMIKP